jgi:tRNA modification GTPase
VIPPDTIFAVASGPGRAAVTVMRISGPASGAILDGLCRRPPARMASVRILRDDDRTMLDQALVLWLPGPRSYTGEDCAELHLHGGRAVQMGVADALVKLGARPAEPGEFTRRAFLNGRMDLTQAEGIADLVEAETAAQRDQALRQMEGALGALFHGWADRLTRLLAQQEALIDFPDEDLPTSIEAAAIAEIGALAREIAAHLDDARRGERLREGLIFAILGRPNVGKSTLINALARRDVAIVSPIAGTTRDIVEARVDIAGVPVTLLDTAGLHQTQDFVEAEGVRRARARAADADLVMFVDDGAQPDNAMEMDVSHHQIIHIQNKIDSEASPREGSIAISALTGQGLDILWNALAAAAQSLTQAAGPPPLTRVRHRVALSEAYDSLRAAEDAALPELRGEDLRMALRSLGRVTGMVGVEAVLDSVFGQFCIGK